MDYFQMEHVIKDAHLESDIIPTLPETVVCFSQLRLWVNLAESHCLDMNGLLGLHQSMQDGIISHHELMKTERAKEPCTQDNIDSEYD